MTEYFRITGLNLIPFDALVTAATDERYTLNASPKGIDEPLTRQEVMTILPRLPEKVRGHALARGLSRITFPFTIKGATDADMEDARHDLSETLEDGQLYIETKGARGTRAVLQMKSDLAVQQSYKTIVYGEAEESAGREVLGGSIKQHFIQNMQMTLYCEPHWRPETAVTLGPNEIYCPSFEEDGDANGRADDWALIGAPTPTWASTIVLHGCYSQKIVTDNAANHGIESQPMTPAAAVTPVVAYAWVRRLTPGDDIRVDAYDTVTGGGTVLATASLDNPPPGGWPTAIGKNGNTWHQVYVITSTVAVQPHTLRVRRRVADATQVTTFNVDKCYWKWNETVIPDEWCDHWNVYNHYDARWLANMQGGAQAGDEGHINYYDVDDLKGDVDARMDISAEVIVLADVPGFKDLLIGRRTQDTPCRPLWWLEAEDRTAATNWPTVDLARCSGGSRVFDNGANAAGSVYWTFSAASPRLDPAIWEERYDVFAIVKTNDLANTRIRLALKFLLAGASIFWPQVYIPNFGWQFIHLGELNVDQYVKQATDPRDFSLYVSYAKDVADDVELDCILLVPKTEPETYLEDANYVVTVNDGWAASEAEDFDYHSTEDFAVTPPIGLEPLHLRGPYMRLAPTVENRVYFLIISWYHIASYREYEAHGAATDLQARIRASYLPQYISPLE